MFEVGMKQQNILVAMSGGVDSAVAAWLLQKDGYDVVGITMRLWSESERLLDDLSDTSSDRNVEDAKKIADLVGIPHVTVSLGESFYRDVVSSFISDYIAGKTPNPCVVCNKTIKFGKLLDIARERGFDKLATGHYARIEKDATGRYLLKKPLDENKDQSYFLWSLSQDTLSSVLFPLGEYTKPEIREIAAQNGFVNAHRADSQDICFIPNGDYVSFIESQSERSFPKGLFLDTKGNPLGEHQGLIRYTVGQRKGLGIALGQPMFVKEKDALANTVTLSTNEELFSSTLTASSVNLIACDALASPVRLQAKIRYRHPPAMATVEQINADRLSVRFDTPQRAIAKGQSLVLYDGNTVVGGGIIE